MQKLKTLDLFSGLGGFSLGLEATGAFETIAFCEINDFCGKVLKKHWPNVPLFKDITKIKYKNGILFDDEIKIKTKIDVICGGFPCQDISAANTQGRGLDGKKSGLWHTMAEVIAQTKPTWLVIENVANLKSKGLATVLQNLDQLRYDVCWHNIPATTVGKPHKRERLYIVAYSQRFRLGKRADTEYQTNSSNILSNSGGTPGTLANSDNPKLEKQGTDRDTEKESISRGIKPRNCGKNDRRDFRTKKDGAISLAHSDSGGGRETRCSGLSNERWGSSGKKSESVQQKNRETCPDNLGQGRNALAHPPSAGLEGAIRRTSEGGGSSVKGEPLPDWATEGDIQRATESTIFRISDGLSKRLDEISRLGIDATPGDEELPKLVVGLKDRKERIQALGNSIVPAIVAVIGDAIIDEIKSGTNLAR